jgi:SAM-dependent methyltransferase
MTQPHFVRDYRRVVGKLIATHPIDEAMALAVGGGDYENVGIGELEILIGLGLAGNHSIIDIDCGSGRLATQLTKRFAQTVRYRGFDIVPEVLVYAQQHSCGSYQFALTNGQTIPAPDRCADFVVAFSVFTHLRRREAAPYFHEAYRTLKPGGRLVFSFLELPYHATIFAYTIIMGLLGLRKVQNHFVSRRFISDLSAQCGFAVERYLSPDRLGQPVAVLRKID